MTAFGSSDDLQGARFVETNLRAPGSSAPTCRAS